jgi:hypothetical protein
MASTAPKAEAMAMLDRKPMVGVRPLQHWAQPLLGVSPALSHTGTERTDSGNM